jgi:DNA-binding MarR family transcriptional regulator/GNAT superfamily N-acetyltransferase
MDYIRELGSLALASRLKRLSDMLVQGVTKIYKEAGLEFETRWFPVTHYLSVHGPSPLTTISKALNQSHPAVVQVARSMENKGLITRQGKTSDGRINMLRLTAEGKNLVKELSAIWNDIQEAVDELLEQNSDNLFLQISQLEHALTERDIYSRVKREYVSRSLLYMIFVEYNKNYLNYFRELNSDWLEKTVGLSTYDKKVLFDPETEIVKKGGMIYLTKIADEVTGTFVLMPLDEYYCELSKFVVPQHLRKMGIGSKMVDMAIDIAKKQNYRSMLLLTHENLLEARKLYEKKGFVRVKPNPVLEDRTGRCSIYMERIL